MTEWLRRLFTFHCSSSSDRDPPACYVPDVSEQIECHRQKVGLDREKRERRQFEARLDSILHEFEALADPRLIRRLRDH